MTKKDDSLWGKLTPKELEKMIFEEKLSYSQIGARYGKTRNTVSGRVFRWTNEGRMKENPQGRDKRISAAKREGAVKARQAKQEKIDKAKAARTSTRLSPPDIAKVKQEAPEVQLIEYAPPPPPVVEPKEEIVVEEVTGISIHDLKSTDCACVVGYTPGKDPIYCGKPVVNFRFRMCKTHSGTYTQTPVTKLTKPSPR